MASTAAALVAGLRWWALLLALAQVSGWRLDVRGGSSPQAQNVEEGVDEAPVLPAWLAQENVKRLWLNDNRTCVYLCGSAHALSQSEEVARRMVRELKPDIVVLELCEERSGVLSPPAEDDALSSLSLMEAMKARREDEEYASMPLGQFLATYYQLRVAKKMGVTVGSEFRGAFQEACAQNVPVVLGDRNFKVTLQRIRDHLGWWAKARLCLEMGLSLLKLPSEEELQALLQNPDAVSDMIQKLGKRYPSLKEVVIDERDRFMVQKIRDFSRDARTVVAVVGAGHLPGMLRAWDKGDMPASELIALSQSSVHRSKTRPSSYVLNAS